MQKKYKQIKKQIPPQKKMCDPLHNNNKKQTKKKKRKKDTLIKFFLFMAMVVLSASVKRFSVSRMRDFPPLFHNYRLITGRPSSSFCTSKIQKDIKSNCGYRSYSNEKWGIFFLVVELAVTGSATKGASPLLCCIPECHNWLELFV